MRQVIKVMLAGFSLFIVAGCGHMKPPNYDAYIEGSKTPYVYMMPSLLAAPPADCVLYSSSVACSRVLNLRRTDWKKADAEIAAKAK